MMLLRKSNPHKYGFEPANLSGLGFIFSNILLPLDIVLLSQPHKDLRTHKRTNEPIKVGSMKIKFSSRTYLSFA